MHKAQHVVELSLLHVCRKTGHKYCAHFVRVAVCWCIGGVGRCWSICSLLRGIACPTDVHFNRKLQNESEMLQAAVLRLSIVEQLALLGILDWATVQSKIWALLLHH